MKLYYLVLIAMLASVSCTKTKLESPSITGNWQDLSDGYIMEIRTDGTLVLEGAKNTWQINEKNTQLTVTWPHEKYHFIYEINTLDKEYLQLTLKEHNTDYPIKTRLQRFKRIKIND